MKKRQNGYGRGDQNLCNQPVACVGGILPLQCILRDATYKNDSNDYNNKIVKVCEKYSNTHPGRSYIIVSVDRVSVDSKCV